MSVDAIYKGRRARVINETSEDMNVGPRLDYGDGLLFRVSWGDPALEVEPGDAAWEAAAPMSTTPLADPPTDGWVQLQRRQPAEDAVTITFRGFRQLYGEDVLTGIQSDVYEANRSSIASEDEEEEDQELVPAADLTVELIQDRVRDWPQLTDPITQQADRFIAYQIELMAEYSDHHGGTFVESIETVDQDEDDRIGIMVALYGIFASGAAQHIADAPVIEPDVPLADALAHIRQLAGSMLAGDQNLHDQTVSL